MIYVLEVQVYDNKRGVYKTLWFRGSSMLEAELRRDDYFVKHIHSMPLSERFL